MLGHYFVSFELVYFTGREVPFGIMLTLAYESQDIMAESPDRWMAAFASERFLVLVGFA